MRTVVPPYRLIIAVVASLLCCGAAAERPENIARRAVVKASSEFSRNYTAAGAIDGIVPDELCQADVGKAWAVNGRTWGGRAQFILEWPQPVTVAEIIYYARTAWQMEECFRDYEVFLDDEANPAAKGRFEKLSGPQRIRLQPATVRRVTLRFTGSYEGSNPGASEIEVYSRPVDEAFLKELGKQHASRAARTGAARRPPEPPSPVPESAELAAEVRSGQLGFTKLLVIERHEITCSHVYTYHTEGFRPGGGLYVLNLADGKLARLVDAEGGQILDCDLSYDGTRVLFSWRRSSAAGYQVFTMNTDGTGLRQLTDGDHHNYNAAFLPDGGIVFLSTREVRFAYCWTSPVGILHRMDADGSNVRRLSANIVNDFTPAVMHDGRIIYSRWEYVDRPAIPIQSLWTLRPDGTGLAVYYGNRVLSPATFMEARPIPGRDGVLCMLTSHNGMARGAVGIVDPVHGVNAQAAIRNLTPEIDIGVVDRGDGNHIRGPYSGAMPIDSRYFVVSRGGTIIVRDYEGTRQATILPSRAPMGFFNPTPVRSRPRPPVVASSLPPQAPAPGMATLYLQDVYLGLEPHVARGQVRRIMVVRELHKPLRTGKFAFGFQCPVISCGATYAAKEVWGYADVMEDGSAAFRVPAGVPIYFLALDAEGRAVQRMRSFTHLMEGEVQGCIGCHEPRNHRPAPTSPHVLRRPPQDLTPPWWGSPAEITARAGGKFAVTGFDYCRIVQPIWDKHCVQCHNPRAGKNMLDLSGDRTEYFNVSYDSLVHKAGTKYVRWISTYNGQEQNILQIMPLAWGSPASPLADLIRTGHPDQQGNRRVNLTEQEKQAVFAWIDLNIPYYGSPDTAWPENRGARQIEVKELPMVLNDVARRRCSGCHAGGYLPPARNLRITNPENNTFLLAPLAKSAGGTEWCGKAIFGDTQDPDYQAILRAFEPTLRMLRENPRMDMPGAKPALAEKERCRI